MYLMKEKQGGPIPRGLKRWPLKLFKHLADTTMHDILRNNDNGLQMDMVKLNFEKAIDTVPQGKLLHKLKKYVINGWLEMF